MEWGECGGGEEAERSGSGCYVMICVSGGGRPPLCLGYMSHPS